MIIIAPIVISIFSIVVSLYVAYRAWHFNEITTRRLGREAHVRFVIEIDKALIDALQLWAVFDDHPLAKSKDNSPEAVGKREAFIYLHYNMFEIVRDYYTNIIRRKKEDNDYWISWENYMQQFFIKSQLARTLFKEQRTQNIYNKNFAQYVCRIIEQSEVLVDDRRVDILNTKV